MTSLIDRIAFRTGPRLPPRRRAHEERDFLEHVESRAALHGWHGIHTVNSQGVCEGVHSPRREFPRRADPDDARGFPDLLLVHPGRNLMLFVELKVGRNRTDAHQDRWLAWTHDLGRVRSVCWWPQDEPEIIETLREGWAV